MARTKLDKTGQQEAPLELQPEQLAALGALLAGATDEEASAAAGVSRSTLSRWKTDDVFVAALNTSLRDAWAEQAGRLYALRGEAITVVQGALRSDDERTRVQAAWRLLELLTVAPSGPTTAAGVENERANRVLAELAW